jgi:hypothetical protein
MLAPLFTSKEKKEKEKQPVPRADEKKTPVDCQIFRRIRRIEKHIPIDVVKQMSQRKTDGL